MKEAKKVGADHRIYVHEKMVEEGYQRTLAGGDIVAQAATLERRGGPCPLCGVEFARIEVNNAFGKFAYYQPACRCFPVCERVDICDRKTGRKYGTAEGCGRFLITEKLAGITYCTSCSAFQPGSKTSAARATPVKRSARKASGKDAASGEKSE